MHGDIKWVLKTIFLAQKLTTSDKLILWTCYFGASLSAMGHYWERSLTHLMLITACFLFMTQKWLAVLYQGLVSKLNQSLGAVWVGTLLILIWSQCFNPLGNFLHAILMNINFIILARIWKYYELKTIWINTKYKLYTK